MGEFFKRSILTGVFVVVPIFISLWIAWFLYDALTSWGVELVAAFGVELSLTWKVLIRIFSLLLLLLLLILIGVITRHTIGQRLIMGIQRILLKVPLIKSVYSTSQQLGDALWNSNGNETFSKAVLFEYPRRGSWAVGFLTNENKQQFEITRVLNRELVSVFIPTTPNPTSGFLFLIPKEDCIILNMSVSEAMKYIVSCGAVVPPEKASELTKKAEESAEKSAESEKK